MSDVDIFRLAKDGSVEEIEKIIVTNRHLIDRTNMDEWTLLHAACAAGNRDVANFLLKHNAQINVQDNDGRTPLHLSCFNGHTKVSRLLVEGGADVRIYDQYERTPLHYAAIYGRMRVANILLDFAADINSHDKWGLTALQWALINGHADIAQMLTEKGADLSSEVRIQETATLLQIESQRAVMGEKKIKTLEKSLSEASELVQQLSLVIDGKTEVGISLMAKMRDFTEGELQRQLRDKVEEITANEEKFSKDIGRMNEMVQHFQTQLQVQIDLRELAEKRLKDQTIDLEKAEGVVKELSTVLDTYTNEEDAVEKSLRAQLAILQDQYNHLQTRFNDSERYRSMAELRLATAEGFAPVPADMSSLEQQEIRRLELETRLCDAENRWIEANKKHAQLEVQAKEAETKRHVIEELYLESQKSLQDAESQLQKVEIQLKTSTIKFDQKEEELESMRIMLESYQKNTIPNTTTATSTPSGRTSNNVMKPILTDTGCSPVSIVEFLAITDNNMDGMIEKSASIRYELEICELQKENIMLSNQKINSEQRLLVAEESLSQLKLQLLETQRTVTETNLKNSMLISQLDTMKTFAIRAETAEVEKSLGESDRKKLQTIITSLQSEVNHLNASVKKYHEERLTWEEKIAKLEETKVAAEHQVEEVRVSLGKQLDEYDKMKTEYLNNIKFLTESLEISHQSNQTLNEKITRMELDLSDASNRLTELQSILMESPIAAASADIEVHTDGVLEEIAGSQLASAVALSADTDTVTASDAAALTQTVLPTVSEESTIPPQPPRESEVKLAEAEARLSLALQETQDLKSSVEALQLLLLESENRSSELTSRLTCLNEEKVRLSEELNQAQNTITSNERAVDDTVNRILAAEELITQLQSQSTAVGLKFTEEDHSLKSLLEKEQRCTEEMRASLEVSKSQYVEVQKKLLAAERRLAVDGELIRDLTTMVEDERRSHQIALSTISDDNKKILELRVREESYRAKEFSDEISMLKRQVESLAGLLKQCSDEKETSSKEAVTEKLLRLETDEKLLEANAELKILRSEESMSHADQLIKREQSLRKDVEMKLATALSKIFELEQLKQQSGAVVTDNSEKAETEDSIGQMHRLQQQVADESLSRQEASEAVNSHREAKLVAEERAETERNARMALEDKIRIEVRQREALEISVAALKASLADAEVKSEEEAKAKTDYENIARDEHMRRVEAQEKAATERKMRIEAEQRSAILHEARLMAESTLEEERKLRIELEEQVVSYRSAKIELELQVESLRSTSTNNQGDDIDILKTSCRKYEEKASEERMIRMEIETKLVEATTKWNAEMNNRLSLEAKLKDEKLARDLAEARGDEAKKARYELETRIKTEKLALLSSDESLNESSMNSKEAKMAVSYAVIEEEKAARVVAEAKAEEEHRLRLQVEAKWKLEKDCRLRAESNLLDLENRIESIRVGRMSAELHLEEEKGGRMQLEAHLEDERQTRRKAEARAEDAIAKCEEEHWARLLATAKAEEERQQKTILQSRLEEEQKLRQVAETRCSDERAIRIASEARAEEEHRLRLDAMSRVYKESERADQERRAKEEVEEKLREHGGVLK